jgi:drug/metabolite transporter (DMT)-like permease
MSGPSARRTVLLTATAMTAFAANSLLCRAALGRADMDPVSFTAVRLATGAAALALIGRMRPGRSLPGSWGSALALFGYAIAFSLAYTRIPAGTGALLLFGAVQATMIGHALAGGARLRRGEWLGLALAGVGLVVLTRPGLTAPDPSGALLMAGAGAAWGVYTLRGRGRPDPLGSTAGNFVRATVPALAVALAAAPWGAWRLPADGLILASASGVLASGAGYALWYSALAGLSATRAAIVQLSAPLLAAMGGVVLLDEALTLRLGIATPLVLGGIAVAVLVRDRR